MAALKVKITVDANGNFTYDSKLKIVKPKDTLKWKCNEAFALFFEDADSPFDPNAPVLCAAAGDYTSPLKIKDTDPNTIEMHKYFVAAYVPAAGTVFHDDPHVIIDNDGGGDGSDTISKPGKKQPRTSRKPRRPRAAKKRRATKK